MTIYRVVTGYGTDEFGYSNHEEVAKYFLNKEAAEAFYKTGEFSYQQTQITATFANGYVSVSTTGANWFEERKAEARPYEKVELITTTENHYRFETIETED